MPARPTLSVCMIVKNEEKNLPRLLSSVRDLADEVIIVDTGSNDGTVGIAEKFGAKVYHFDWCDDFASARNVSLSHATKDFIMWLDGDDEIPENQVPIIRNHLMHHRKTGVFLRLRNIQPDGNFESVQLRIFPNHLGLHFEGRIHEQIITSLARRNVPLSHCNGLIIHHGYDSPSHSTNKLIRNKEILEKVIEDDPRDFCAVFFLARTLRGLGRNGEAAEVYDRAIEMGSKNPSETTTGLHRVAFIDRACIHTEENNIGGARGLLEKGLLLFPQDALIRFTLGELYFKVGRHDDAYHTLLPLKNESFDKEILPMNVGIVKQNLDRCLGISSLYQGDFAVALECLQRLPLVNARDSSLFQYIALAREQSGDIEGALKVCKEGIGMFPEDGPLKKRFFLLLVKKGAFDEALMEFGRLNGLSSDIEVTAAMFFVHCRRLAVDGMGQSYSVLRQALHIPQRPFPEGFTDVTHALKQAGESRALELYKTSLSFLLSQ